MHISAYVLVKNEARFVWYSVMSVINYVDKVLLWDTGSTDNTPRIIEEIKKTPEAQGKVFFKQYKSDPFDEEEARQRMLSEDSDSGWFIVVDGDEVWWDASIGKLTNFIRTNGDLYESIVVPTVNGVGDIFHYQEEKAGGYHLLGKVGHYNLRAVRKDIPGLKSLGGHGVWGWADKDNRMIQDRDNVKIKYLDTPYFHLTHLRRSTVINKDREVIKRTGKYKYEIGTPFPLDYYYPEVFFRPRPDIVLSPWDNMNAVFKLVSYIETPLRKIKRRIFPKKIGY